MSDATAYQLQVLQALSRHGAQTLRDLARVLGVSLVAPYARKGLERALVALKERGAVRYVAQRYELARPLCTRCEGRGVEVGR